jgi:phage gp36-like protein
MTAYRPTSTTSNTGWAVTGTSAHGALDDATDDPGAPDLTDYIAATPGIANSITLACGTLAADATVLLVEVYVRQLLDVGDAGTSIVATLLVNGAQASGSLSIASQGTVVSGWFSVSITGAFVAGDNLAIRLTVADAGLNHLGVGQVAAAYLADPADVVSPLTAGHYNTQTDLENRWGIQNIQRWSNLVATVTTTDTTRVQLAIDYAASEIDDYFAGSRYTVPFTGYAAGSGTSVKLREWANVLAGKWLADARFHATNEAVPDDLIAQLDAVYTDMALHRSGVRGFGAMQVFSNHPAVPVTTG